MIINVDEVNNIYLANQFTDMRKSINGLVLIVNNQFELNHSLFIFTNRTRNRIKILYYENNRFWLFFKRLEYGKFKVNEPSQTDTKTITPVQLNCLSEGLEFENTVDKKRILV